MTMRRELTAQPYPAWTVWSGMVALIVFSAQTALIVWLGVRTVLSASGDVTGGLLIVLVGASGWTLLLFAMRFLLRMRYAVSTSWKLAWLSSLGAIAALVVWMLINSMLAATPGQSAPVGMALSVVIYWAPIVGVAGWVIGVIVERSRRQNRFG